MSQLRVNTITNAGGTGSTYAPGHVVQVVNVDYVGQAVQGFSTNSFLNVTGLEARITPKSVNSKIVIQARWFGEFTTHGLVWDSVFGLSRNGAQIGRQAGQSNSNGITIAAQSYVADDANSTPETMNFFLADFPATTSEVIYQVTLIASNGGTLYTNRTVGQSTSSGGYELGTSGIMLMEVAQ
jgi:hypothetical protein